MTTNDQAIEAEIKAKGKTAPRVTPAAIEANIFSEHYFTAGDALKAIDPEEYELWVDEAPSGKALNLLTFCVLVLKNGFTVNQPAHRPRTSTLKLAATSHGKTRWRKSGRCSGSL